MIAAGLQIPNFTYPQVAPAQLFERVAAIATTAESAGFDTVMVMDHFYQLPMLGPPEHDMLEAYTLLGALAARTSTVRLGTLVTGVTYRHPALLAKIISTLDVISGGRAFLGIGAAWYDLEHEGLGVPYPPVRERFELLEEALVICQAMFAGERPTIEGRHVTVRDAINSPAPLQGAALPIMVGGQGERKALRLMAQYAQMANFTAPFDELARKLEVLAKHCDDVGTDFGAINKTPLASLILATTNEQADAKRDAFLADRGLAGGWDALDDATKAMLGARMIVGDADAVGEQVAALLALGLDGITVNLPADGHDLEAVAHAGEVLAAATRG